MGISVCKLHWVGRRGPGVSRRVDGQSYLSAFGFFFLLFLANYGKNSRRYPPPPAFKDLIQFEATLKGEWGCLRVRVSFVR